MELHPSLRDNVRLLGDLLGQIMVTDRGGAFLDAKTGFGGSHRLDVRHRRRGGPECGNG